LVLNNGSTDRTAEKVHSLQGDIDFDFVNFEENVTLQEARNFLLKNCNSSYAIFSDADGTVSKNYLDVLNREINGAFSIYSGPVKENRNEENYFYELHYLSLMRANPHFLIGANFVVNSSDAIAAGGFPNLTFNRGDESPLIINMKEMGFKHLYISNLETTNNFANSFYEFYKFAFYEGINSLILNNHFSLNNNIIYSAVRSIVLIGIFSLIFGLFNGFWMISFGAALIALKIYTQKSYWKEVLKETMRNFSFLKFLYLLGPIGHTVVFDIGYWYAKIKRIKSRQEIVDTKRI
jgi:hypothetical protein